MFDNLVQSAVFPVVLELLHATDTALANVKTRLTEQREKGEPMTMLLAEAQLEALAAWEPVLADIMKQLDTSHQAVHGTPLPRGR